MGSLIDSSILIAAERGDAALDTMLRLIDPTSGFAIAAITASELLHGVHRAKTAAQRVRREAIVEQFLAALPVIPFDLLVARVHARVDAELMSRGIKIPSDDLAIAATALAHNHDVVTRDERSFPRVPSLTVVRW